MVEKNVRFRSTFQIGIIKNPSSKKSTRRHRRYDSLGGQDATHSSTDDMITPKVSHSPSPESGPPVNALVVTTSIYIRQ